MAEALAAATCQLWLEGEKLRGGYTLQRTARRGTSRDGCSSSGATTTPAATREQRAASRAAAGRRRSAGRTIEPARPPARRTACRGARADDAGAMKAVLTRRAVQDPGWIFERKLDGIRCMAIRDGGEVRLLSRNDLSLNGRYPEVAEALGAQEPAALRRRRRGRGLRRRADELRAARPARATGACRFLLRRSTCCGWTATTCARCPLRARKALLRDALDVRRPAALHAAPQRRRRGVLRRGLPQGLGGADRQAGRQPVHRHALAGLAQAQVRAGPGARDRRLHGAARARATELGALLVGYYDGDGQLRYAGKVGTGFDERDAARPRRAAARRCAATTRRSPTRARSGERGVTWVEPELVAQVGFTEWTRDGRLRHPRFLGLREDKAAREVVREAGAATPRARRR